MKLVLALLLVLTASFSAFAQESIRDYAARTSILSFSNSTQMPPLWFSSFMNEKKPAYFTNASGAMIMMNPVSVTSAYDSTTTKYSMSRFYAQNADRYKIMAHINGLNKGEIIHFGFDTGMNSQKMSVGNAFFVGTTKTFQTSNSSLLNFSVGSWLGGSINESPCTDSYGRQYSCRSLTTWQDYKPYTPQQLAYADLKFIFIF
jgi:hypothetical protein